MKLVKTLAIATVTCVFAACGKHTNDVTIINGSDTLCIVPLADNAVRVIQKQKPTHKLPEYVYLPQAEKVDFSKHETDESIVIELRSMTVKYDKSTCLLTFTDKDNNVLFKEKSRSLTPDSVSGEATYSAQLTIDSPSGESIFGGGQFQDGYLNIRGLQRRLTQVNTQISIPFFTSSRGFSLLWNNYGLTDFNPSAQFITLEKGSSAGDKTVVDVTGTEGTRRETRESNQFSATLEITEAGQYALLLDVGQKMARTHHLSVDNQDVMKMKNLWLPPTASTIVELSAGTHSLVANLEASDKPRLYYHKIEDQTALQSPVAAAVDYTVFAGEAEKAIATYRQLTGQAPMMPSWALGYIHCRERYHSSAEIIENAQRFRSERIPMDMIVQDWQWWGKYGWNAMQFDETYYPNPKNLVDSLHQLNARLMLSVWSKIDPNSTVGQQLTADGHYIDGTTWIDFFSPAAADAYWQNFSSKLLKPYGIDAWWQDATEPENDDLEGRRVMDNQLPGEVVRNIYPLMVSRTVYEGLRTDAPDRRHFILTRSGAAGQQRYASALWSGDVGNDWETLRRQIIGGLGLMASGTPWWTYDAGGFFRPWGQYTDEAFHELYLRWLQTAVYLPLMRTHGYMSNTEPWHYGDKVKDLAREAISLRYKLLPYIYSATAEVSFGGSTLMRPLVMDFPNDSVALACETEFMFGKNILVSPVLEAGITKQNVYLPKTEGGWYDLATNKRVFTNGENYKAEVRENHIPAFVKAGTILPQAQVLSDVPAALAADWEIRIYPGADGEFNFYLDDGETYAYEQCNYVRATFKWDDAKKTLSFGKCEGTMAEGLSKQLRFVLIDPKTGATTNSIQLTYTGLEMDLAFM